MIEFKADCGHTVRAKDEDAGKVVRCAYCGCEVQVPDEEAEDDFDFFFANVVRETTEEKERESKTQTPKRRKKRAVVGYHPRRKVDPFNVVKKMAYIAVIIIVAIFVGRKYAWPFIQETFLVDAETAEKPDDQGDGAKHVPLKTVDVKRHGLISPALSERSGEGLYVNAVPHDLDVSVFYRKVTADGGKWDESQEGHMWVESVTAARIRPPTYCKEIREAGVYEVVVMLPLNAPELVRRYKPFGYSEFRSKVEARSAKDKDRDEAAGRFFLPDEAKSVRVVTMHDRINIVRTYEVKIRPGEWEVLTPLFVPASCTMREVSKQVIERDAPARFRFDKDYIINELQYYNVSREDWEDIIKILGQTGAISYWRGYEEDAEESAADGRGDVAYGFRLFQIDPSDGGFEFPDFVGERRKRSELREYRY